MQIMINISDAVKEMADEGDKKLIHIMWMLILIDAIKNGVVLPKGHGDLIDKKVAYKKFYSRCLAKVATEVFDEIPTIIEADKEGGAE